LLGAIAAGAGFEALENLEYAFNADNVAEATGLAIFRGLLPLHICWTGLVGVGLARRLFRPEDSTCLLGIVLPVMLLHGLYDFSALLLNSYGNLKDQTVEDVEVEAKLLLCIVVVVTETCRRFASATGCRLFSPRSCCCSPEVWDAQFPGAPPVVLVGVPVAARHPLGQLLLG